MADDKKIDIYGLEDLPIPFADYVQVSTDPNKGTVFTFAQSKPPTEKYQAVAQVFLPLSVVGRLVSILVRHLAKAEVDTGLKLMPENVKFIHKEKEAEDLSH